MAASLNDQGGLDRARAPGGIEQVAAAAHFAEQDFPLQTHARPMERADGVLAALVKHPRWVDRDM
jgi:hypothetical protein